MNKNLNAKRIHGNAQKYTDTAGMIIHSLKKSKIYTHMIDLYCINTSCSTHNKIVIHQIFQLPYSSPLQWPIEKHVERYIQLIIMKKLSAQHLHTHMYACLCTTISFSYSYLILLCAKQTKHF